MTSLADRIRAREPLLGLLVKMPAPSIVETAGHVGFDFVILDTEHGEPAELTHHLRAAGSAGVECIVRVGDRRDLGILQALDAGAAGVVVPHVRTGAQARDVVLAAHYPPAGRRGLSGTVRAGQHGVLSIADHVARARQTTVVLAQIEDHDADADEIAAVQRLSGVFLGRMDLSASLGVPGQLRHPDVVAAVDRVVGAAARHCAPLAVLVSEPAEGRDWAARGARLIVFTASALFAACLGEIVRETRA
jgi:4-hydroxy-2-oxoheptanedioate aldolase